MISCSQLTSILLVISTCSCFGQEFIFTGHVVYKQNYERVNRALNYENINGSPYLVDDLIEGNIRFTKGKEVKNYLRYNAYTDEMEYLYGDKLMVITNANQIDNIRLGNYVFNYLEYVLKPETLSNGYLIKIVDGSCKFYKKLNVDFIDAHPALSSYDAAKPAIFEKRPDTWFLAFDNTPPFEIILDKKVVDRVFDKFDNVKQYAKQHKLKAKNPDDFAQVVKFFNAQNSQD